MNAASAIIKFQEANKTLRDMAPGTFIEHTKNIIKNIRYIMEKESCNPLEAFICATEIIPEIKNTPILKLAYMASIWEIYESNSALDGTRPNDPQ